MTNNPKTILICFFLLVLSRMLKSQLYTIFQKIGLNHVYPSGF